MTAESCSACRHIAARRGVRLGDRIPLRAGHVGTVALINHCRDGIVVLVHSSDEQETLLLSLEATAGREGAGRRQGRPA